MTTTIDIPGGTAQLRDPDDMTVRQRNAYMAALMSVPPQIRHAIKDDTLDDIAMTEGDMQAFFRLNSVAAWAFLDSWTLDRPLPALDEMEDLPVSVHDALLVGVAPLIAALMHKDASFGPDGSPDPSSPTEP